MSNKNGDISDDEIRIISSESNRQHNRKRNYLPVLLSAVAAVVAIGVMAVIFMSTGDVVEKEDNTEQIREKPSLPQDTVQKSVPFVTRKDTVVNDVKLSILTPHNASPTLEIGNGFIADSTVVLVAQAADVREDNGKIAGSFVAKGELISKGEAKAGFCSIIDGKISIGVADATPMFERALTSGGYFFRQYPLVVGGQIVENRPKGKSLRKALVEYENSISVIISENKVSLHDFSQALVDAGVRNAIYLVGGDSYARCKTDTDETLTFGKEWENYTDNVNYIVWR